MGRNDAKDREFFKQHAAEVAGIAERARRNGEHDKADQAERNVQLAEQQLRKIDVRDLAG